VAGIAAAAAAVVTTDSQVRDRVEGRLDVGFAVYFVRVAGMGVAETIGSGLGGKICRADGSLGDLGQSAFCSIPGAMLANNDL
jgi:hypothetical protein